MSESENSLRTCTRCLECHPVSFFNKDRTRIYGVYPQCKNCSRRAGRKAAAKYKDERREQNRKWRARSKERIREVDGRWKAENRDKVCGYYRAYRERHPEVVGKWQRENPEKAREVWQRFAEKHREKRNANDRAYAKANPDKIRAKGAKRRAALLNATPAWADNEMIALIYSECLPGYEVDHIYPLRGRNSCGLHVVENLQYLTASENYRKSNKKPDLKEAW